MAARLKNIMDVLLIPIVCCLIYVKLIDAFGNFNLNLVLAALIVIYALKWIFLEKSGYFRLDLGLIGIALVIVLVSECLVYIGSSYKSNSYYALVETLGIFLLFYFIKSNVTKGTRQLAGLFTGMLCVALLYSTGALIRFFPAWAKLKALGFQDMTYFKDNLLYGDWVVNALLLLPYPIILLFRFKDRIIRLILLILATLVVCLPLLLSFSRGAYIASLIFVGVFLAVFLRYRILPSGVLLRFGSLMLVLMFLTSLPFIRSVYSAATMFQTASQSRSVSSRKELWTQSLNVSNKHPLLGVGAYNYAFNYMANAPRDDTKGFIRTPQNTFVGIVTEKGIVGLAAYLFLLLTFFYSACRLLVRSKENFEKAAIITLVSALIAVCSYLMTYYAALGNQGTTALIIVLFACLDIMTKNKLMETEG
jgi:hypothetical protein